MFVLKWKWKKTTGFTGFIIETAKSSLDVVPRGHSVHRHSLANREAEPKRWLLSPPSVYNTMSGSLASLEKPSM